MSHIQGYPIVLFLSDTHGKERAYCVNDQGGGVDGCTPSDNPMRVFCRENPNDEWTQLPFTEVVTDWKPYRFTWHLSFMNTLLPLVVEYDTGHDTWGAYYDSNKTGVMCKLHALRVSGDTVNFCFASRDNLITWNRQQLLPSFQTTQAHHLLQLKY